MQMGVNKTRHNSLSGNIHNLVVRSDFLVRTGVRNLVILCQHQTVHHWLRAGTVNQ